MDNRERKISDNERLDREEQDTKGVNETGNEAIAPDATPIDLDGDGFIGNTGGFYGGTSYIGSNYGADWNTENSNRHEGNYGAAGQQDDSQRTERLPDERRNEDLRDNDL